MTTVQVGQIAEIIERQRDKTLKAGDVAALEAAGQWIMERSQREVTEQYDIMHDPFQACSLPRIDTSARRRACVALALG